MMTLELMEAFSRLVEYKSFVRAADSLYISQSTLSSRIKSLESELGVQLIVRSRGKRSFELTAAGTDFIAIADRWIMLAKETSDFKLTRRTKALTVASIETLSFLFSNLFHSIAFNDNPEEIVSLETHTYSSPQIISEVENQNVDIGFAVRQRASKNLIFEPILREHLYLVGNIDAQQEVLDPRQLSPAKEIITDWSSDYQEWHAACLGTNHAPLATIDTATQLVNFIEDGAWCVIPESAIPFLKKNCEFNGIEINTYRMPTPPPDRICYKVKNKATRANRANSIALFESRLYPYLTSLGLFI